MSLLQHNKSLREAFLKLPRELDGSVAKDVLVDRLARSVPKEALDDLVRKLPRGECIEPTLLHHCPMHCQ